VAKLSIVIPAFNEGHRILETLQTISAFCERSLEEWELIVVDDGSRDSTSARVGERPDVRLLRNERNLGKGFSVRRGMLAARLDPVLFTDADLSTPIDEATQLLRAIESGAGVAVASRLPRTKEVRRTAHRRLMAAAFRWCVKLLVLRGFHDTQCGFKMFRREAVQQIFPRQRISRWGFDVEVLFLARRLGISVFEVPVSWHESTETRLRMTTPLFMLLDLLRIRWNALTGAYGLGQPPPEMPAP
jgi:dolichyl-phosphate beta-glucosyltransferase